MVRFLCYGVDAITMKVGDYVVCGRYSSRGLVVGFNKKGEGGQDFVHVLIEGEVIIFMHFDLSIIQEENSIDHS